jgi:hypothetical protein
MFTPFESLPRHSRTWIYQSDKKITAQQKNIISEALYTFTEQWLVHGAPMQASFNIYFDQFVILAANDQASGCSIDSSVRALKSLGESLNIDFFNRNLVIFKKADELVTVPMHELKKKQEEGIWNSETLVFNNVVGTKDEFESNWIVPAGTTWLKRYLPRETAQASNA